MDFPSLPLNSLCPCESGKNLRAGPKTVASGRRLGRASEEYWSILSEPDRRLRTRSRFADRLLVSAAAGKARRAGVLDENSIYRPRYLSVAASAGGPGKLIYFHWDQVGS
jgi:hypothetical protein